MPIIVSVRGEQVIITLKELGRDPTLRMLVERVNAHWRGWKSPLPPDIWQYYHHNRQFYKSELDTSLDQLGIKDGTTLITSTVQPKANSEYDLSPRAAGIESDGTFDGLPTVMQQSIGDYLESKEIKATTGLQDIFKLSDASIKQKEQEERDQIVDHIRKKNPTKYKEYDEAINFLEKCDFPDDWSSRNQFARDDFLREIGLWEKYKLDGFLGQLHRIPALPLLKTHPNQFLEHIVNTAISLVLKEDFFNFLTYGALKCGAKINDRRSDGDTALIALYNGGVPSGAQLLLEEYGADINGTDKHGRTALMMVCARGFISTVELLLKNSAAVNHVTQEGESALMIACRTRIPNNLKVVSLLLKHKADVTRVNKGGETAYSIAKQAGLLQIIKLLNPHQTKNDNKIGYVATNLTSHSSSGMYRQPATIPPEKKSETPKDAHTTITEETLGDLDIIIHSSRCQYNRDGVTIRTEPNEDNMALRDQFNALFQQHGKKGVTVEVDTETEELIIRGIDPLDLQELIKPRATSSACLIS